MACGEPYGELHRPQFHFTPRTGWTNDPNGLVFYRGQYHLFFQHNPVSVKWGNMTWGHALSTDLVHWRQVDNAICPDELGTIYSGSAVVDWHNTSGFGSGEAPPIVAIYTSAGDQLRPPRAFTQSIAFSPDAGRTWQKYGGNPVLAHIRAANRDPKVIWHEPTSRWVMALYLDANDYILLGSKDLKNWQKLSDVTMPGTGECPDLFELPVDGDPADTRWVFWGAAGAYRVGRFDGTTFTPETDSLRAESGANGYAAQTYSDIPSADGRRIQISWMLGGKYPAMPFNQQLSFPVELTLRQRPEGLRLCRRPVRELALLHARAHAWRDAPLAPGRNLIPDTKHDLFDIHATIDVGSAKFLGLILRGIDFRYDVAAGKFTYLGRDIPVAPDGSLLRFQLLVDRTSLEFFTADGSVSASFCFLPEACDVPLEFYADGEAKVVELTVQELKSAW
ncbi:MAG: glycoside hydrolase family 32 protein [Planctomycetota bacterium]